MFRALRLLAGVGLGAGLMYMLDPKLGRRRRALLRDQANKVLSRSCKAGDARWRDAKNRLYGVFAETRSALSGEAVPDDVLIQRVRSEMGRHVAHPSSIEVLACNGEVTLSGPVLSTEVEELVSTIRGLPGVMRVHNELVVHQGAEEVRGLQGS